MAWDVAISGGGAPAFNLVASDNAFITVNQTKEYDDQGNVQTITTIIVVEGDIAKEPDTAVGTRTLDWFKQSYLNIKPCTVTIKQNGTTWKTWSPGTSVGSPVITGFEKVPEPGTGSAEFHQRVRLTIRVTEGGAAAGSGPDPGIESFRGEMIVARNPDGQTFKKTWRIRAKATKLVSEAITFCKKQKPSGVKVQEEENQTGDPLSAAFTWVYWGQFSEDIIRIEESPPFHMKNNNPNWAVGLRVAPPGGSFAPPPVLQQARRRAGSLILKGQTISYSPIIVPPAPHYGDSSAIRRLGHEPGYFEAIFDRERGWYVLQWEEHYIVVDSASVGEPDHGDHGEIMFIDEPKDRKVIAIHENP